MSLEVGRQDYIRAEGFLPWNAEKFMFRAEVKPNWINGSDRFWYRVSTRDGVEYITVDAASGTREPAFDHARLAAALSVASGEHYDDKNLPFSEIQFAEHGIVRFSISGASWECDKATYECSRADNGEDRVTNTELPSPSGTWIAFAEDHNLWIRNHATRERVALTNAGTEDQSYATPVLSPLLAAGLARPDYRQFPLSSLFPAAIWSPDSKKIVTHRLDERGVGKYHLVQSVPLNGQTRPQLHSFSYPLPGDEQVPGAELVIIDVEDRNQVQVEVPALDVLYYGSPLRREPQNRRSDPVWWSEDAATLYVLQRERGYQGIKLYEVDATTGASKVLISESSSTPVDPHLTHGGSPSIRVVDKGASVIWFSQRSGWGHLYLYDASGKLKHQITAGSWAVANLLHVDEEARMIYFTAVGREADRDPYFALLYRVSIEGGQPQLLTPEDADHTIEFSPSGKYFVDSYSRVDSPPRTVVRNIDGTEVLCLESADIELLQATGWRLPERFTAKARDGITDVYGVIIRPSNFDPSRSYPVIDSIYAGPQVNQAPVSFADIARGRGAGFWQAQAIAEIGFIVVMIDGLGMPFRSRSYHDVSFRNLGDGGLPDHIYALRQLAQRYPYLNLERVGIYGHSAGGYASCHAIFAHPDFYKVCVASAGNHDHRLDKASWVERYMGLPVDDHYVEQANQSLAHQLKGKLLLMHGEMDENVHVSSTLVVVDALIKANKDFDLLILPNRIHACGDDPYFIRRRWDYFTKHLLGAEPPKDYAISGDAKE